MQLANSIAIRNCNLSALQVATNCQEEEERERQETGHNWGAKVIQLMSALCAGKTLSKASLQAAFQLSPPLSFGSISGHGLRGLSAAGRRGELGEMQSRFDLVATSAKKEREGERQRETGRADIRCGFSHVFSCCQLVVSCCCGNCQVDTLWHAHPVR